MGIVKPGPDNPNWRGGRTVTQSGYVLRRVGKNHHLADVRGYAYEHRIVAEETIGRRLVPGEHVHHKDGNKGNNDPANLEVLTAHEHGAAHRTRAGRLRNPGEPNPTVACLCGCRARFRRFDSEGRWRDFLPGHNSRLHGGTRNG
jgi:hypothetical protein